MSESGAQQLVRRRRARNIALALALLAMVVLFYFVTIVRMAGNTP